MEAYNSGRKTNKVHPIHEEGLTDENVTNFKVSVEVNGNKNGKKHGERIFT